MIETILVDFVVVVLVPLCVICCIGSASYSLVEKGGTISFKVIVPPGSCSCQSRLLFCRQYSTVHEANPLDRCLVVSCFSQSIQYTITTLYDHDEHDEARKQPLCH